MHVFYLTTLCRRDRTREDGAQFTLVTAYRAEFMHERQKAFRTIPATESVNRDPRYTQMNEGRIRNSFINSRITPEQFPVLLTEVCLHIYCNIYIQNMQYLYMSALV